MLTSYESVFIQVQVVVTTSAPSLRNKDRGRRLTKNASFTAVLTLVRDQFGSWGLGVMVVIKG